MLSSYNVANIGMTFARTIVQKRMCLKKGLPQLTSSKVVFRTFLDTLKQIMQSCSSCITDCQHEFEKRKRLENELE